MSTQSTPIDSNSDRPNIIILFTDDQRFDTIRALGNDEIQTPNLDRLTQEGTTFSNAYIMGGTSPAVCMPSRAMLMTGRTLFHLQGRGESIPDDHILLGESLQAAGYNTFGTGKWHNGSRAYARSFNAGAEIFFGGMDDHWNIPACDFDPTGQYPQRMAQTVDFVTQRVVEKTADHIHAGKHSSELFADAAVDYLQSYDDKAPFFVYLSFMAPHDPRTMPQEYLEMYDPDQIEVPANFLSEHPFDNGEMLVRDELLAPFPRTPDEVRRHLAAYYAMITHADAQIGRVIAALEATGKADNTIIVFAGDNGLALGRHGLFGKQNLYDHSLHVPMIMAGPGIPAATTAETFCYLLDIYPTLCELAGLAVPDSVEGQSLVPALGTPDKSVRDSLYFAYRGVQRAVQDRQHKLIEYRVEGEERSQLFDLQADPWEMHDLAADPTYAGRVDELKQLLARWRDELDDSREDGQIFWESAFGDAQ